MSDLRAMMLDTVNRLFADARRTPRVEGFDSGLWQEAVEMGLPQLLVPESGGGAGGDWEDAGAVLHALGYHGAPIPLAESLVAAHLAAANQMELPAGVVTLAPLVDGRTQADRFTGVLRGVPWGRHAQAIVAALGDASGARLVLLKKSDAKRVHEALNLANEPRDDLHFDAAPAITVVVQDAAHAATLLSLARCAQIAGALEAALHRSVEYAQTRKQFGRAIGQFQAVQQQLALFASDAAAAACAARSACRAASRGDARFQIAAAKLRCNLAVGLATSTAHQVHAAIGFTHEFDLRQSTQRLWSWRSEGGNDRVWADRLGAQVCAAGADSFWADLTARDDSMGSPA